LGLRKSSKGDVLPPPTRALFVLGDSILAFALVKSADAIRSGSMSRIYAAAEIK
jgi:hypothetical protein